MADRFSQCWDSETLRDITVFIADDHALTLAGLRELLGRQNQIDVVGEAANGIEAIARIKKLQPDIAILDLSMPDANGMEVFLEGKRWSPKTRFAFVTGNPSASLFSQLVEAGVHGIFLKNSPSHEICDAILRIAKGETVLSKPVRNMLAKSETVQIMTARENEVLQGIARGLSNAGIAEQLGVSPKTVDTHRSNLMRKMGVHTTATLLVKAMKEGLIDV